MFKDLQALVECHEEENQKQFADHKERIDMLEGQVDLLKKMGAPKGDGGAGLLDTLEEITDKMRKEFQEKIDNLEAKIKKVDEREEKMDLE